MSKIKIPEIFKKGFTDLAKINDSTLDSVVTYVKFSALGAGPGIFIDELIKLDKLISVELAEVIYSFGALLNRNPSLKKEELALDLVEAYKSNDLPDSDKLYVNLIKCFDVSTNLKLTTKAIELLSENENVYLDSRILSDVRLVFNDSLENENRCALILHNLKLSFQSNNEEKEFYLSLDKNDLLKLKEVVERAIEKDNVLRKDDFAKLKFIDINE
jgi:hypothetical protein